ncbi:MAG: hypothetical protein ACJARZ_002347 [Dokdonia sp.]|jgi:hypothetical protein
MNVSIEIVKEAAAVRRLKTINMLIPQSWWLIVNEIFDHIIWKSKP